MTAARMGAPARIAVLGSGGGSNLQAILDHFDAAGSRRAGTIVLVASDRADAGALDRGRRRDIPAVHIPRPADGIALDALLAEHDVELIALAGYLKLVPAQVTRRYQGRIINIHPALLPAFGGPGMYGLRAHQAVLDAGVRVSGASAHFVDDAYDRGALIAQWPVPVLASDTAEALAARVLRVEHLLYPRVVDAVASGAITLGEHRRVHHHGTGVTGDPMFAFTSDEEASVQSIGLALG